MHHGQPRRETKNTKYVKKLVNFTKSEGEVCKSRGEGNNNFSEIGGEMY